MERVLTICAVWGLALGTIYHEGSKTILTQIYESEKNSTQLFGYSVMLRDGNPPYLLVGDPTNNIESRSVFTCPISSEEDCELLFYENNPSYPYKSDSLAGAAVVDIGGNSTIICAPSWGKEFKDPAAKNLTRMVNGLCYLYNFTQEESHIFYSRPNQDRLTFTPECNRTKYPSTVESINYFAYSQTGFSASVSPDHNWLLLGAPGLLDWTGGVIRYDFTKAIDPQTNQRKYQFNNPFYTEELGPNSYFGYSVDAGVFVPGEETLGVGGAPRGNNGDGEVFVFSLDGEENDSLNVRAHLLGTQFGEYFGSAVLVIDVNQDGRADLLVGAPYHVHSIKEQLTYDQGLVYVYMNVQENNRNGFKLMLVDQLMGSGAGGAMFGSSIADLGDLDGDGYSDVAIGAPWEGPGTVYIYRGHPEGIRREYTQKISGPIDLKGFGFSISRGLDIDNNGCNDLAVGTILSGIAIVLRCFPTLVVQGSIRILNATNSGVIAPSMSGDPKNFTAQFCIVTLPVKKYSNATIDIVAKISIDFGIDKKNAAVLLGETEFTISAKPENEFCLERFIQPSTDVNQPINLNLTLRAASEIKINGTGERLGVEVQVVNHGEPAYTACMDISLPASPLNVPNKFILKDMEMRTQLPRLFFKNETKFTIELEQSSKMTKQDLKFIARVYDSCVESNSMDTDFVIKVEPRANITGNGRSLPNRTVEVDRSLLERNTIIDFAHAYEISNYGPSDWPVKVEFSIFPLGVELVDEVPGCSFEFQILSCSWQLGAHKNRVVQLRLRINLQEYEEQLKRNENVQLTTQAHILHGNKTVEVTSWTALKPAPAVLWWPIVVATLLGLLFVALIVYGLYKAGFFKRTDKEKLKKLLDEPPSNQRFIEFNN